MTDRERFGLEIASKFVISLVAGFLILVLDRYLFTNNKSKDNVQ